MSERYEKYANFARKVAKVRGFLFRNRILLISVAAVIALTAAGYVGTKGMIIEDSVVLADGFKYTYGEDINVQAKAFLSGARYQFSPADKEEWSFAAPTIVGKYKMRAAGESSFGEYYGETHYFEIAPKDASVSVVDLTLDYGEDPKFVAEGLLTGHRLAGTEWSFSDLYSLTPDINVSAVTILDAAGTDVTANYSVAFPAGEKKSATITPRLLNVELGGQTLTYNAQAQTFSDEYTITQGALREGDFLHQEPLIGTNAGTYTHGGFKIVDASGKERTQFYNLTVGKLDAFTIAKRAVSISSISQTKTYDGKGWTLEDRGTIAALDATSTPAPDTFTYELTGDYANSYAPGKLENAYSYELANSENYEITTKTGTLEIEKRDLRITIDGSWAYQGNTFVQDAITDAGLLKEDYYKIDAGYSLADGDVLLVKCNLNTETNVYDGMTFTYQILHGEEDVSTSCYNVTVKGAIATAKANLSLQGQSKEFEYDGKSHGLECEIEGVQGTDKVTLNKEFTDASITDVGTISGTPSAASILNSAEEDRSIYYTVSSSQATTKITAKPLKILAKPHYAYVGEPLNYTLDSSQYEFLNDTALLDGDELTIVAHKEALFEGAKMDPFTPTIIHKENGADVTSNYDIDITSNASTTLYELTLEGKVENHVYDGTTHQLSFQAVNPLAQDDYSYDFDAKTITEPGSVSDTPTLVSASNKATGENTTPYYNVTTSEARITVTERPLVITCQPVRTFAGYVNDMVNTSGVTELDSTDYIIASGEDTGLVGSDYVRITTTKNIFALTAEEEVQYVCKVYHGDGSSADNCYDLTLVANGYTATKGSCEISFQFENGLSTFSKVYDGTTTTPSTVITDFGGLTPSVSAPSTAFSSFKSDVGEYSVSLNSADFTIYDNAGVRANTYYDITNEKVEAALTITKRPITFHFHGAENNPEVEITDGTLVSGHSYSYTYVDNGDSYTYDLKIKNGSADVTKNYEVTTVIDTFADTDLTLTMRSFSYFYNGVAQYGGLNSIDGLRDGDSIQYVTGSNPNSDFKWTDVGSGEYEAKVSKITDSSGRDVTCTYNITVVPGTWEIKKAPLTITLSGSRTYNGTLFSQTPLEGGSEYTGALTGDDGMGGTMVTDITSNYLAGNDTLTITPDDSTIFVEDVEPQYTLAFSRKSGTKTTDVSGNYDLTSFDSSGFTYNKATLYVHGEDQVYSYDGKTHTPGTPSTGDEYGNNSLQGSDKIGSTTYDPTNPSVSSINDANNGHVDYTITGVTVTGKDGDDRTKYYDINYGGGSISIDSNIILNLGDYYGVYTGYEYSIDECLASKTSRFTASNLPSGYKVKFANLDFLGTVSAYGKTSFTLDNIDMSTVLIQDSSGNDVTSEFEVSGVTGSVTLDYCTITLSVNDVTKNYDGQTLKVQISVVLSLNNGKSITWGNSVYKYTVTFAVGDDYINAGEYVVEINGTNFNVILYGDTAKTQEVDPSNYTITGDSFTVTIKQRGLTIETDSFVDYTGYEIDLGKLRIIEGTLANGDSLTSSKPGSKVFEEAGTYANDTSQGWTYAIVNKKGQDVTSNYDITEKWGTITIIPDEDW